MAEKKEEKLYDLEIIIEGKTKSIMLRNQTMAAFNKLREELMVEGVIDTTGTETIWWPPSMIKGLAAKPME